MVSLEQWDSTMPLPFAGAAVPLAPSDIAATAASLGCSVEIIQAVDTVETGGVGGFLRDGSGRARILCEAKHFGDATDHRYDVSYPLISCRVNNWKLYIGGAGEYSRLAQMALLDRTAALCSTSWGRYQVLGSNATDLGYASVEDFVAQMAASEANHLDAFARFCRRNGLVDALRDEDCIAIAEGYNGRDQAAHGYSDKLQDALYHARGNRPASAMLRIGDTGARVGYLQHCLTRAGYPVAEDEAFGRVTDLAVRRLQSVSGKTVDGIVGPATWMLLGGEP